MPFHFTAEQHLPYPIETVFAFFADPANLPRLMPAWQDARIDSADYIAPPPAPVPFPGSDAIQAGTGSRMTMSALAPYTDTDLGSSSYPRVSNTIRRTPVVIE